MCISLKLRLDFSCKAGLKPPILLKNKVFSRMPGQKMPLGWWFHLPCILPSWVSCAPLLLLLLSGSQRQLAHVAESLELAGTTGFEGDAGRERLRWSSAFWLGYVEPPRVLFGDEPQPCPKPLGLLWCFSPPRKGEHVVRHHCSSANEHQLIKIQLPHSFPSVSFQPKMGLLELTYANEEQVYADALKPKSGV